MSQSFLSPCSFSQTIPFILAGYLMSLTNSLYFMCSKLLFHLASPGFAELWAIFSSLFSIGSYIWNSDFFIPGITPSWALSSFNVIIFPWLLGRDTAAADLFLAGWLKAFLTELIVPGRVFYIYILGSTRMFLGSLHLKQETRSFSLENLQVAQRHLFFYTPPIFIPPSWFSELKLLDRTPFNSSSNFWSIRDVPSLTALSGAALT